MMYHYDTLVNYILAPCASFLTAVADDSHSRLIGPRIPYHFSNGLDLAKMPTARALDQRTGTRR